ncbi:1-acyl-sn-glycerol-3-phosphate acyltransferase [Rubrobacter radiotolerans]|uniref:1-acyl-sn-glycerol-3-phosphate acyltransferase n=1 Tax=Rubrobacter radiotolerans TaxID=42256 RepID=A0A023X311_RUBRA|nr:lysophospholipid acyltransferase family protein [Rubrobacter radiotolerans]AHY46728.1 1-acyl-sn-glycerol-3-phosphate acyltransferase [Rubrobacter radiotolerans]MDX5894135.1 lysophospholipid acyltransferase family protein [Rubrobacter radiotolerans]SMC05281.1 1-acyl-sn-glycerol-3-phosphate acyltransferase [Rubrobacter radiotolerans DSM 5868]
MATLDRSGMSARYGLFRRVITAAFAVLVGFRVNGEENVPRTGAVVVAANHWRFFDPVFVCLAVPRRVQWMAKKELFLKPLVPVFGLLGAFPVDREGGGRAAIRTALLHLKEGWAIGIFPEGTRRKKPEERRAKTDESEAKSGAVMLAGRSGAPILPVFIGPFPTLRERLAGKRLEAYVGEPIYVGPDTKGREAYRRAANEMVAAIYALPSGSTNGPAHDPADARKKGR